MRAIYNLVSTVGHDSDVLLNFGYAPPQGDPRTLELSAEDEPDRYGIQLYHRIASAIDLRGKTVLEVGSGRGGGASFVARYLAPASVTGLDFSARAVAFCRRRHRLDGLTFLEGDAQQVPFADGLFDVVLNVESSHSYQSFERFLAEVRRVLRPEGAFLFADFRPTTQLTQLRDQLRTSGLTVVEEERITDGVFRALALDTLARRVRAQRTPRLVRKAVANFAALEGTPMFEAFRAGHLEYWRFVLEKRVV